MMIHIWRAIILCIAVASVTAQDETCNQNGDLRLLGGSSNLTGRVEICYEGVWGTICDDGWDDNDAIVVCRQLGHSTFGARAVFGSNYYAFASGPIYLDSVECQGDEEYLVNCTSLGFREHDCNHFEDAGVNCEAEGFTCNSGDTKLVDGGSIYEGRVEVCIDNKYTSVCDFGSWGENEAIVVCSQLNFTTGGSPIATSGGSFGGGIGEISLRGLQCDGSESNLLACPVETNIFTSFCNHFDDAGVLCPRPDPPCEYGDIRLLGSSSPNEGRIEICINGHWGTICHNKWGSSDAEVACRQLGYSPQGSIEISYGDFGSGTDLVLLSDFDCNGMEETLINCTYTGVGEHFCRHSQDAGVICMDPNITCTNGSMRLAAGESDNEGRLEVCFMNHWGTVCDDQFSAVEAALVCRELGYPSEGAIGLHGAYFGAGVGLILLDDVNCEGNETTLFDCSHLGIRTSNCFHSEDVSILCQDLNPNCTNGDVRLVNGTGPHSGRVEVCFNGRWGSVCDDNWGSDDAEVVCNQLGYPGESVGLHRAYFGKGSGPIFLDDADCSPTNHSNLVECFDMEANVGVHNCDHSEDAGVICSFGNRTCDGVPNGGIRLVGGSSELEGRVELCLDGVWGTICDGFWSRVDAVVVCSQLSFGKTDAVAVQGAFFGPGTGPVYLDRFFCTGSEKALVDCFHRLPRDNTCSHNQDSSVICSGYSCTEGEVRLVNGQFPSEGRVEICMDEQFGTVCGNGWDNMDAKVVCRRLGYNDGIGAIALPSAFFGRGTGTVSLGNVDCTGEEGNLAECPHVMDPFCFHSNDASVLCQSENASLICSNGDIRLAGSGIPYEGLVEICFNGQWGTVCHDGWDQADAVTVCRILGYGDQNLAIPTRANYFSGANVEDPVLITEISCNGTETSLLECLSEEPGDHDCSHFLDAGVICNVFNSSFECNTSDVRLVNGGNKLEGRVEVCINGKWGTVCDNGWGSSEAIVVCGQLGYDPERSVAVRNAGFGRGTLPIFFSFLDCTGDEENLLVCPGQGPGSFCSHSEDAGVICRDPLISVCSGGDVRLTGGVIPSEGTVEVCREGEWAGTICDRDWDDADAAVICRQLGYPLEGAIPLSNAFYGEGAGSILVTSVDCVGNETSIGQCPNTTEEDSCSISQAAGVICTLNVTRICSNGDVRLVDGPTVNAGRVELCLHGQWGMVCDDDWGGADAKVVCNQLGYMENEEDGVAYAVGNALFGSSDGRILLDNVACEGDESTLLECQASPSGENNCSPQEAAGVFCPAPGQMCTNGEVRLADGNREGSGRVEFCLGGTWTTHCGGSQWDDEDAMVICRQLGYPNPETSVSIFATRAGDGPTISTPLSCNGTEERVADCPLPPSPPTFIDNFLCPFHIADAGVICIMEICTNGNVRLLNGSTENEGRVEICLGNEWGTICDDSWDANEATVVCRQLGYSDTLDHIALSAGFFGRGADAIHLDELSCTGDELMLIDCPHGGVGEHNCFHEEDAGVVCSIPDGVCDNGDLQLVGGSSANEGRVEVCFGGRWGTICDDSWDHTDAMVVCGQLGFSRFDSIATDSVQFGRGTGLIFLDELDCLGNETSLLQCPANDPGLHNCMHTEDIGVICSTLPDNCEDGDIRLRLGYTDHQGTVQFCLGSNWGTICDVNWGNADAAVVCRQLGFIAEGAVGVYSALFGSGYGNVHITDVMCSGNETRLDDCPFRDTSISCTHDDDAGVICPPNEDVNCTSGDVLLADGDNSYEGRVEVCIHGRWGTVCDNGWDVRDATVVCRQLGYTDEGLVIAIGSNNYFGSGDGFILFDNLGCDGTEPTLTSCSGAEIGRHDCHRFQDVAVICPHAGATCANGAVRLVSSNSPAVGRIEVCMGDRWTTICGNSQWEDEDTRVACRQLGFNNVENVTSVVVSGGEGPVFLNELQCRGDESSLLDCPVTGRPASFLCLSHNYDAGVICNVSSGCSDGDVRLANGEIPNVGRVEICFNGVWGTICDDRWGQEEATVVCRQLGYSRIMESVPVNAAYYGRGITPIHLDDMECSGSEASLAECSHNGIGNHNCNNDEDAGVICIADNDVCNHGDLRLVNGLEEGSGRVEVCIGGVWGSICDDGFETVEAGVTCRLLGYLSEGAMVVNITVFGMGTGFIFLDDLDCIGNETSILDCNRQVAGGHNCLHVEDVGIICEEAPICVDGDIMLVGGEGDNEGTLNVCLNEEWGTVCDDLWSNDDASVVCRQLGYPTEGAVSVRGAFFGSLEGTILLSDVECTGSEDRLLDCPYAKERFFCLHSEDAGVICQPSEPLNCTTGDVRLEDGSNRYEGRVEICLHGRWGTICDDEWDGYDAAVVCRQLGYTENGAPFSISNAAFGPGGGFIILDSVDCVGNETSVLGCRAEEIGMHNCLPSEDAGVFCPYVGSPCTNGEVRLVGGDENSGRVELCLGGTWGTICRSYLLIDTIAEVICRQLGYENTTDPIVQSSIEDLYGEGTGPIIATSPSCDGTERRITDCTGFSNGLISFCDHSDDIGVNCQISNNSIPCTTGDVRLIGGAIENEGRVEVCNDNNWGTVCDDDWDQNDTMVVCRQLGYDASPGNSIPVLRGFFGEGSNRIHLDGLHCNGMEPNLLNCSHDGVGVHNCGHTEDAGVICIVDSSLCDYGEVRLVRGDNALEGRVEVCLGGRYGTVCDDRWDDTDASVVCRQLGFYPIGAEALSNAVFGQGVLHPIFIDDTECVGNESGLIYCPHSGVGNHNCFHFEDASVRCKPIPCTNNTFQLVGGLNSSSDFNGQVEVCVNGIWGPVCSESVTNTDVARICSDLGGAASLSIRTPGNSFSTPEQSSNDNFDFYNISSTCSDDSSCNFTVTATTCESGRLGVFCPISFSAAGGSGSPGVCETGSLRLVGGKTSMEGRVEVCINDQWGTVCDDSWDKNGAAVICKQLGLPSEDPISVFGEESVEAFGLGSGPIWLDDVKCDGTEVSILSCSQIPFPENHNCEHSEDAGVRCPEVPMTTEPPLITEPPTKEPTKEPTKFTDKPIITDKGGNVGAQSNSSHTVIILIVFIVILLFIVVVIIFVIIIVVIIRSRRNNGVLKFNNEEDADNTLVESDFLEKEGDIPMKMKDSDI